MRYITPEIILRHRLAERPKPRWDVAVVCFRGPLGSQAIVQRLNAIPVGYKTLWGMDESTDLPYVHETAVGGARICVVSRCAWGGPQAAILVEELAYLGVTRIIGFGAAGSLVPDLRKGTQVVASTAIVTDGTSRAHTEASDLPADGELYAALEAVVDELGADVIPVRIATVDAVYRETEGAVQQWLSQGAQTINMETSPLYAASVACGVKSLWLGHISDSLLNQEWDTWMRAESITDISTRIAAALVERVSGLPQ